MAFGAGVLDWLFSFRGFQQFCALYRKNVLVAWRNRRATLLRIIAPFCFLVLALLIDRAIQANERNKDDFTAVTSPDARPIDPIPRCEDDIIIRGKKPCIEVLYSPSPNAAVDAIMAAVKANNKKNITVEGRSTREDIQSYLLSNPDTVLGAVHFDVLPSGDVSGFLLQVNTTRKYFKGEFQNVNLFMQLPLQNAVQREIARYSLARAGSISSPAELLWATFTKPFAHPTIATTSVLGQVLGPFVFAACMFSFVTQIGVVVQEKELGLKQALRTMGMTDFAYWTSWGLWEVTLAFIIAHSICIFGLILQFRLFLDNNYGVLFFLFFLFQLAMSSFALMLSALIRRTQVAVYLGFLIFIIGWVMQTVVIFGVPYTPEYYKSAGGAVTVIFALLPWNLLSKGFNDLGSATVSDTSVGISWSNRKDYCQNVKNPDDRPPYDRSELYRDYECVMSLNSIYWILFALWIGYFVIAIYLDNVVPNEHGVKRAPWYFLDPGYWVPGCCGRSGSRRKLSEVERTMLDVGEGTVTLDQDVAEEEEHMKGLAHHRTGMPGEMAAADGVEAGGDDMAAGRNAVEVYGLQKLYRGSRGCCGASFKCCAWCESCSCEVTKDFWAIKGSWFCIPQGQLFCLLGPNGAGKTTTINCLTGVIPPTHGEAVMYGQSMSSAGGIDAIRSMMGVCPQFDIQWGELTGREHLSIYGHIKGLPWRKVSREADELLEKVKLTGAAEQRTAAYSGGMRRRLSVAIALLGDPRIVFLDEPTTGMDPISRRYVWDIIQEAKKGRAIVLTTHSMEEADILGDRIAIMARGRLRCLGSSLRLKQRFGSGYSLAISVMSARSSQADLAAAASRAQGLKDWVRAELGLAPVEESRAYVHWLVPREREGELVAFLERLEGSRARLGVSDVQLSLTSLEEVFLNIARQAEMEAAAVSGQTEVDFVLPDGTTLQIPMGAELVQNPVTGVAYRVRWGTDESGRLVIMDCTALQPNSMQPPALAAATPRTAQALAAAAAAAGGANGTGAYPGGSAFGFSPANGNGGSNGVPYPPIAPPVVANASPRNQHQQYYPGLAQSGSATSAGGVALSVHHGQTYAPEVMHSGSGGGAGAGGTEGLDPSAAAAAAAAGNAAAAAGMADGAPQHVGYPGQPLYYPPSPMQAQAPVVNGTYPSPPPSAGEQGL